MRNDQPLNLIEEITKDFNALFETVRSLPDLLISEIIKLGPKPDPNEPKKKTWEEYFSGVDWSSRKESLEKIHTLVIKIIQLKLELMRRIDSQLSATSDNATLLNKAECIKLFEILHGSDLVLDRDIIEIEKDIRTSILIRELKDSALSFLSIYKLEDLVRNQGFITFNDNSPENNLSIFYGCLKNPNDNTNTKSGYVRNTPVEVFCPPSDSDKIKKFKKSIKYLFDKITVSLDETTSTAYTLKPEVIAVIMKNHGINVVELKNKLIKNLNSLLLGAQHQTLQDQLSPFFPKKITPTPPSEKCQVNSVRHSLFRSHTNENSDTNANELSTSGKNTAVKL